MTDLETSVQTEEKELLPGQPAKRRLFGKKEKKKKSPKQEIVEWILTLGAALVIALLVRQFIFEPVRVDGHSMDDTLAHGEVMFVTKFDYQFGGEPERFDVVICHYPGRGNTNFVKRVVGLPGDTVALVDGYLYVNGERYEEPYLVNRSYVDFGPYSVPEGYYFMMGDNRSNSNDSRSMYVGPITRDMILGRVSCVLFPFNHYRGIVNGLDYTGEPVILAPEAHD